MDGFKAEEFVIGDYMLNSKIRNSEFSPVYSGMYKSLFRNPQKNQIWFLHKKFIEQNRSQQSNPWECLCQSCYNQKFAVNEISWIRSQDLQRTKKRR